MADLAFVGMDPQPGEAQMPEPVGDHVISDGQARTLASLWRAVRDVESPALSKLADSGEITRSAAATIRRDLLALQRAASTESEETSPLTAQSQLAALLTYVVEHGPREPLPGWGLLPEVDPSRGSLLPWADEAPAAPAPPPAPAVVLSEHGHREAVFDLIGGVRAIEDLVETFYDMIMGDRELAPYFAGFSVAKIKQHQLQFLMAVTGGPNIYVGRPLRVAHAALQISPAHFARTADHLDAALTVKGIDPEHRSLILARVNALRRHVVNS